MAKVSKKKILSIIVIIVVCMLLITSIILQIINKDPLETARKKSFIKKIQCFQKDLNEFVERKKQKNDFDIDDLNARREAQNRDYDLEDILPCIKEEYIDKIEIQRGELVFVGKSPKEEKWFEEATNNGEVEEKEPTEKNESGGQ